MTIDANIVIAYLAGETAVVDAIMAWRKEGTLLLLPTVAETEVLAYSKWTKEERFDTMQFLGENFHSVPFDRSIAYLAAEIRSQTKIKFPDVAIAATALFTHTPVVTRNVKDFKKVPSLEIVPL